MINAEEALAKTWKKRQERCADELNKIETKILESTYFGRYSAYLDTSISEEAQEALKNMGYKVNLVDDHGTWVEWL